MTLRHGHFGYAYQDILTGNVFVDLLLGAATSVKVDLKDFAGDLFDDITITYATGRRLRVQIKHTTIDRELSRSTFTANGRHLRLDLLLKSLLTDLSKNPGSTYRVVVRDRTPDNDLAKVLKPVDSADDPGDPFPGIGTHRYRFDPDELGKHEPWRALLAGLSPADVTRACHQLIIDTDAPEASLSLAAPGTVETALTQRAIHELGAGKPPNVSKSPEEVALTLILAATRARATTGDVTRADIAAEVGLATDFGAVREGHPVESAVAVERTGASATLKARIDAVGTTGGRVVIVGEPGAGKSWLSEQTADAYRADGWIVARHHCWLGETDTDRNQRVLADVVIGSLLRQLELAAPSVVTEVRPRYAATLETLEKAIRGCRAQIDDKPILLIVDGLDHIDRVQGRHIGGGNSEDPARTVVEQLASIELPPGTCLVFASQPGSHLDNAKPADDTELTMPRMSTDELAVLADRHHLLVDPETGNPINERDKEAIVDLLHTRSNGNALYATYLCRHATGASPFGDPTPPATVAQLIERLRQVPETATDIDAYYKHLLNSVTPGELQAIGALAICDFALTKEELGEVVPAFEPLLDGALGTLAPVLVSLPGAGGLKVHHESLSRHIRRDSPPTWVDVIRKSAADWLRARGFFNDTRAFRNLPQLLAELGEYDELRAIVDPDFVTNAVTHLQPPDAIKQVLATIADGAQRRLDWLTLITCIEALRAVTVYEGQSLPDSLVEYADVVVRLHGADLVAERLIYEGRSTFPARWGLSLCEAIDRSGGAAPWVTYLEARKREAETENTSYGSESDNRLHLAQQLGHLRQIFGANKTVDLKKLADRFDNHPGHPPLDEVVEVFARAVPAADMLDIANAMTDTRNAADVFITLADLAADGNTELPAAVDLSREALKRSPAAYVGAYLDHGIPPADILSALAIPEVQVALTTATENLFENGMGERPNHVRRWLDLLRLAHATDPALPLTIGSHISGDGFYRAWLRFAVATVGLDEAVDEGTISAADASAAVRFALHELAEQAGVRVGEPRTVDLWSIHYLIHEVIESALLVVEPADLDNVLENLTTIGNRTTMSMTGMAENGPLATNDLLSILSRVAGRIGVEPVRKLMPVIRENRDDTETMYSVTADFEIATARICLGAGDEPEARACWERAAALLAAYGGHKDSTTYEFIESTDDLHDVDPDLARRALARVQDASYLTLQHTNGKGTNGVPTAWWVQTAHLDPIGAATNATTTRVLSYGFQSYLAQEAHVELLARHADDADPIAMAALRLTVGTEWRKAETDQTLTTRLRAELGRTTQADTALAIVANNIAASYDNQTLTNPRDLPTAIAPAELIEALKDLGGPDFAAVLPPEEPKDTNNYPRHASPDDLLLALDASLRPVLEPGPNGAAIAARDYQDKGYQTPEDSVRYNLDAFANAVGWRIIEATIADGPEGGKKVLDAVVRELSLLSADEPLTALADGLARHCIGELADLEHVASYAYTLAYIHIRGAGGWHTLAGRKRTDLWVKARELHPGTAHATLAAALAYNIATERQGILGTTQGLVAAFAASPPGGTGGTAVEVWNTAFDVLEKRLPGKASRVGPPYAPTPMPDDPNKLDDALAALAVAKICHPTMSEIRAALLALTTLLACRPGLAQAAVLPLLKVDLDAPRTTWLLETLRDFLPAGELQADLRDALTELATSTRLSVRALAGEILQYRGHTVPDPPATSPDHSIRITISRALGEDE